jgi:hypothetical protein
VPWRMCWKSTHVPTILDARRYAWTRPANNSWVKPGSPSHQLWGNPCASIMNMNGRARPIYSWCSSRWRVKVTERRTAIDFAHVIRELVDEQYPHAEKIVLVLDNLNTHKPASLYEAFAPTEARRLLERLEIHYTPKHGSWLDMAETELSVLATQCLDRRIPDRLTLTKEVATWERQRNAAQCRVDWRFTTHDARIKLTRLYPSIQLG